MAQSVTRRAALKKFGIGLAGMALAGFLWMPAADAKGTAAFGINDNGVIVGCYVSANGSLHGFMRSP